MDSGVWFPLRKQTTRNLWMISPVVPRIGFSKMDASIESFIIEDIPNRTSLHNLNANIDHESEWRFHWQSSTAAFSFDSVRLEMEWWKSTIRPIKRVQSMMVSDWFVTHFIETEIQCDASFHSYNSDFNATAVEMMKRNSQTSKINNCKLNRQWRQPFNWPNRFYEISVPKIGVNYPQIGQTGFFCSNKLLNANIYPGFYCKCKWNRFVN